MVDVSRGGILEVFSNSVSYCEPATLQFDNTISILKDWLESRFARGHHPDKPSDMVIARRPASPPIRCAVASFSLHG